MLPGGHYTFPAQPTPTTERRIAVTGRRLDMHPATNHDLPLRGRRADVLEHVMEIEYEDAPGEPLSGCLRYAWILPPDTPPGLTATLEIGGRVITLSSESTHARRGRRGPGSRKSDAWSQAFVDFLLAQGFERLALTGPGPRRGGERSEPVYGYLKMCLAEGEVSSDDEDPRVQARRLPIALASGSSALAEAGDRSARAHSARSHQREQKRRATGRAEIRADSAGEAAVRAAATPPAPAARDFPLTTRVSIPVHGWPAPAGSAAAAAPAGAPGPERQAEALEPGTAVTTATGDPRNQTFVTSVVTPPDFPSGLTLRFKWGNKTMLVSTGDDGNLRGQGDALFGDHGTQGPLDPWRVAELETEGYVPVSVQVPQAGKHARRGAPLKTYTLYIRHRPVDPREEQGDAAHPDTGSAPALSRREQMKKSRKREAQRRAAALRKAQAQPGTVSADRQADPGAPPASSARE